MILNNRIFNPKFLPLLSIATCSLLTLAGCQSIKQQPISQGKTPVANSHPSLTVGKSSLNCAGIYTCEITSIGKTSVISQLSHSPSPNLSEHPQITIVPLNSSNQQAHVKLPNYLVSFPSGQQLVATRFYLEDDLNSGENFSFIHNFESGKRYELKAYRQIQKTDYSLLAQSAPTPLCVDLYENDKLANKWCKKPNQQGALSNEFIKVPL